MSNVWGKYKEAFISLAYVIILVILFMFAINPLFAQIREKRNYAEEKAVEQEITQKKIKELPQLKEKMTVVKQEETKLDVFFSQGNALPLIQKIEALAAETGNDIVIEIVSESNTAGKNETKKTKDKAEDSIVDSLPGKDFIVMRFSLAGDFNSASRFMQKIESMDYFSDITSIKMSRLDKADGADKIVGSMGLFNSSAVINEKETDQKAYKYETPLEVILEMAFYQKK